MADHPLPRRSQHNTHEDDGPTLALLAAGPGPGDGDKSMPPGLEAAGSELMDAQSTGDVAGFTRSLANFVRMVRDTEE